MKVGNLVVILIGLFFFFVGEFIYTGQKQEKRAEIALG